MKRLDQRGSVSMVALFMLWALSLMAMLHFSVKKHDFQLLADRQKNLLCFQKTAGAVELLLSRTHVNNKKVMASYLAYQAAKPVPKLAAAARLVWLGFTLKQRAIHLSYLKQIKQNRDCHGMQKALALYYPYKMAPDSGVSYPIKRQFRLLLPSTLKGRYRSVFSAQYRLLEVFNGKRDVGYSVGYGEKFAF